MSSPLDFSIKRTVLVVDDTPEFLATITDLLKQDYTVKAVTSGANALQIVLSDNPPDLILLDIAMPEMDGYEVLSALRADARAIDIPVIFVTAMDQETHEEYGLSLGAIDYISKPISPAILLARVRNHLRLSEANKFLKDHGKFLSDELNAIQDVAIHAFVSLAETRDNGMVRHVRRTENYVRLLGQALQDHPRFSSDMTDQAIARMSKSATIHDIGKVGVPDRILLKAGPLDAEEYDIMKTHTTIGRDVIERAEIALGFRSLYLEYAKEMSYSHHERWDGEGYPQGLIGDSIPISARLMALADAYDVLISGRHGNNPVPHAEAVQIIGDGKGAHFDPDVVEAFMQVHQDFHEIATQYADNPSEANLPPT